MARKRVERNISYDDVRKKFYVNLDFGFGTNGKQIKKTQTFSTITEARKALRAHEVKKDRGEVVQPRQTTVADWLRYWLENIVRPYRAETTVYGYRNMIENYLVPRLGKIQLQALTPQKIQRYYTDLLTKTTLSSNTVRKHHDLLRTALDVAVRQQMIATNLADRVEAPKTKTPERHFYSPQDLTRLLQCAEGHRLELVIKLAAYLGLRREEYCGLTGRMWTLHTTCFTFAVLAPLPAAKSSKRKPKRYFPPARCICRHHWKMPCAENTNDSKMIAPFSARSITIPIWCWSGVMDTRTNLTTYRNCSPSSCRSTTCHR